MANILDRPGWQIVRAMRAAGVTQEAVARALKVERTVVYRVIHRSPEVALRTRERVRRHLEDLLTAGPALKRRRRRHAQTA